jgi:hypothetical protein
MTNQNTNESTVTESALTAALKQAQSETSTDAPKAKRTVLSKEDRDARDAARRQGVEDRKAERLAKKASKPERAPAHMAKVSKAAEKLPALHVDAQDSVDGIMSNFSTAEVQAIIAHLSLAVRTQQTLAAVSAKLEIGQLVRIVTHTDTKHVGLLARVTEVRRIRSHVQPLGTERRVYVFNSDVELVTDASSLSSVEQELANVG